MHVSIHPAGPIQVIHQIADPSSSSSAGHNWLVLHSSDGRITIHFDDISQPLELAKHIISAVTGHLDIRISFPAAEDVIDAYAASGPHEPLFTDRGCSICGLYPADHPTQGPLTESPS